MIMATASFADKVSFVRSSSMQLRSKNWWYSCSNSIDVSTKCFPSRWRCCVSTSDLLSLQRRLANYKPNIWHDSYIQSLHVNIQEAKEKDEIDRLIHDIRDQLIDTKDSLDQIEQIDALLQLGIAHHFQEDINYILATIFSSLENISSSIKNDLHATSLLFRLLREHGFNISSNVFDGYKEEGGNFKSCLNCDIQGMLSLYEASYLGLEGEESLDEARIWSKEYLKEALKASITNHLVKESVAHALELPLHWRMPRLHTRWFIDQYERKANMNPTFFKLAKLDFNYVQSIHKRELKEMSCWWTYHGLGEKLDFSRNRLLENFFWTVGGSFEPKFWRCREATTKANCLITVIDDIYDVYGTLDELELFTDVVEKWNMNAMELLPDYMKSCFQVLFDTTNDIAYDVRRTKGVNVLPQLKKAWLDLCKAYLVEAKWYHNKYMPRFKEYMDNAWISISGHVALTIAYCTSEDITERAIEQYKLYCYVIRYSSLILRLCNDLETSKAEQERGDVPKAIQCYMHENNVSEAIAREYIRETLSSTWKKLNGEWVASSCAEELFKSVALNVPRMAQCIYQYGDGYGEQEQETKDRVISLLIEPIPL